MVVAPITLLEAAVTRPIGASRSATIRTTQAPSHAPQSCTLSGPGCIDTLETPRCSPRTTIDVGAERDLAVRVSAVETRLGSLFLGSTEEIAALRSIMASRAWQEGTLQQRVQIVRIIEALPLRSTDRALFSRGHSTPFQTPMQAFSLLVASGRLLQRGATGTTLLSEIDRFTANALAPVVAQRFSGETAAQALVSVIEETLDPARIEQDNVSTCTVTSLCYELAKRDPAEYARVCAGLLLDGAVTTRGGQTLHFDDNGTEPTMTALQTSTPPVRTMSERALQSALMQAAFPAGDYTYSAGSTGIEGREGFNGRLMAFLPGWLQVLAWILFPFGIAFSLIRVRHFGLDEPDFQTVATSLLGHEYHRVGQSLNNLRDHLGPDGRVTAPVFVSFSRFNGGAHMLSVVALEGEGDNTVLICRNPWGSIWINVDGQELESVYGPMWQTLPENHRPPKGALAGVRFESSQEGTIRIPLSSRTGRSLYSFVVPE